MARIGNLIAALDEEAHTVLRAITAGGHNAEALSREAFYEALNFIPSTELARTIRPVTERGVGYRKISLDPEMGAKAKRLLDSLSLQGEIHYPFASLAGGRMFFLSVVDYEMIGSIVREMQIQSVRREYKTTLAQESSPAVSSPRPRPE